MKFRLTFLTCVLFMAHANLPASMKDYYVSPSGNDGNDGSFSYPFKTLAWARDAVRNYKNSFGMTDDIYVYIRQGTYELPSTLTFDNTDSGINGHKIIYTSYNGEEVIISGGTAVPPGSWISIGNYKYTADITSLGLGSVDIRQLYIDGQRGIRARLENNTNYNIHAINSTTYQASSLPTVVRPAEVEVVARWHGWQWTIKKVQSMTSSSITLVRPLINSYFWESPWHPQVMYLENAYEYIDSPGEWYYDKTGKDIYLRTFSGYLPGSVVIPRLDKIISGNAVSNLTFEGLTFSYSTWPYMNDHDFDPGQACSYYDAGSSQFIPGNINFKNSSSIVFFDNIFCHLGAIGLCIENNSSDCHILSNEFFDISAEAIRLGEPIGDLTDNTRGIEISGNNIHDNAIEFKGSVGIFIGLVNNSTISNNTIYNLPYTGISIGFRWSVQNTTLGNITVTNNTISNVVNLLNDGAGIYNLGQHSGQSHITNNYISGIPQNGYIRGGVYLDQGSNNVSVDGNWGVSFRLPLILTIETPTYS